MREVVRMPLSREMLEEKIKAKQARLEKIEREIQSYKDKIEDKDERTRQFRNIYHACLYDFERERYWLQMDLKKLNQQLEGLNG